MDAALFLLAIPPLATILLALMILADGPNPHRKQAALILGLLIFAAGGAYVGGEYIWDHQVDCDPCLDFLVPAFFAWLTSLGLFIWALVVFIKGIRTKG